MPVQIGRLLLKNVGKAALNLISAGTLGDLVFDVAAEAMEAWTREQDEAQRRLEMQAIAQAAADEVRAEVARVVQEIAGGQPAEVQAELTVYLTQVPATIRRELRRPDDPSGRTTPANLSLRTGDDLAPFLPTATSRFRAGDVPPGIGNRTLVEMLGVGGFGEVWKAVNPQRRFSVPVALKFCLDPQGQKLLEHEADLLDRILQQQHEHERLGVVRLLDTYLNCDPPCLEYEYVDGGDLSSLIRHGGALGANRAAVAAGWILELAETVGHFHRLAPAIVHRDLKPANVLIERLPDGAVRLKVGDFGIGSVAAARQIEKARRTVSQRDSLPSMLRGSHSPLYASPEQERGSAPDPRDDVHALGVLWHQMLSCDVTRGAPRGRQWTRRLCEQGVEERHVDLLAACIEEEADDRPRDAAEVADELRRLLTGQSAAPILAKRERPPVASAPEPMPQGGPAKLPPLRKGAPPGVSLDKPLAPLEMAENSLGMKLALIPPGEFLMGSPEDERGRDADETPHPVRITRPFYIAAYLVTQEQFQALMSRSPSRFASRKADDDCLRCPVERVSWFDAVEFCNMLSGRDKLPACYRLRNARRRGDNAVMSAEVDLLGGAGWRLPTEAEWEYACRAGTAGSRHFSDESALADYAWHDQNAHGRTHPVGQKKPNSLGLFDLYGNVWEWCHDWHAAYSAALATDPTGPASGERRVLRGGAWKSSPDRCRSACRLCAAPASREAFYGFRVARTAD